MTDMQRYAALFAAGNYHGAHDALEGRWLATRAHTLHGLIQLAVGWYHLSRGNLHGARVLWTKALRHLESAEGEPDEGVDLVALREHLRGALALLPSGRRCFAPPPGLRPPAITVR